MSGAVTIKGGRIDVDELVAKWMPDQKTLEKAVRTASNKTMRWARALAVRAIRAEVGVPAALLRARINAYTKKGKNGSARLFFGLRPIPAAQLAPHQTKAGVRIKGGGLIPGAFLVDMGLWDAVFKRAGKERYPLAYQRVHFHDQAFRAIKGEIMPQWQEQFMKILEQELKWRTR